MILAALLALSQASPPQRGVYFTGNRLYAECQLPSRDACVGYVIAISDMLDDVAIIRREPRTVCLGEGVESGQLVDVVIRYLRDHPEIRHASAASMVTVALQRAFPCPRPTRR